MQSRGGFSGIAPGQQLSDFRDLSRQSNTQQRQHAPYALAVHQVFQSAGKVEKLVVQGRKLAMDVGRKVPGQRNANNRCGYRENFEFNDESTIIEVYESPFSVVAGLSL
jgi:hypothetical protein